MMEFHTYTLGADDRIVSRHDIFCKEASAALVEPATSLAGATLNFGTAPEGSRLLLSPP
ncbi:MULTISPECIES: hypothetical protein [unclassified Bradyrhizobium]|uniref:hypothetical protein n=1 Tax=unclassified Bradyrhizobium TaxID=2631580 RepID=UPI0024798357|nr:MULTISPECIES: hypothetical protein [unclassified Bradyrhizobium]WGS20610.1 hypothetical protein MTX22_01940 [Bradyrhizobium sp. ISRA463]WGS27500.1 hypothetical protein MTX19_38820 [Bradyrhizobium sp. ISRA464]